MVLSPEIWNKIRAIEIQTRRMLSGTQVGNYTTAYKGSGFEFDQLREYSPGDDVRFIDWPGSARAQKLLVRQYHEERNRTILLIVDLSPSANFGSTKTLKKEQIAQLASVLSLVAHYGKDTVGLILCGGSDVQYIPPGRGMTHIRRIMTQVFAPDQNATSAQSQTILGQSSQGNPKQNASPLTRTVGTDVTDGIEKWLKTTVHRPLAILISDFIDHDFGSLLNVLASRAETIAIRCLDTVERQLPVVGLLSTKDAEYNTVAPLSIGTSAQHHYISWLLTQRIEQQTALLRNHGIELLDVTPGKPFMGDVISFFRKRRMY